MDQNTLNAMMGNMRRAVAEANANYKAFLELNKRKPMTVQDEVNTVPGRRIPYMLNGTQSFVAADAGSRAPAINFLVSQDGPFVWTHYPMVAWYPSAPSDAANYGRWSPVASWPLPTQQAGSSQDVIDISFEIVDGGVQRNYQNTANGPGPLSRPDNIVPMPEWSVVASNSVLQFIPTYNAVNFASDEEGTTGGTLFVTFIGFRIISA